MERERERLLATAREMARERERARQTARSESVPMQGPNPSDFPPIPIAPHPWDVTIATTATAVAEATVRPRRGGQ